MVRYCPLVGRVVVVGNQKTLYLSRSRGKRESGPEGWLQENKVKGDAVYDRTVLQVLCSYLRGGIVRLWLYVLLRGCCRRHRGAVISWGEGGFQA